MFICQGCGEENPTGSLGRNYTGCDIFHAEWIDGKLTVVWDVESDEVDEVTKETFVCDCGFSTDVTDLEFDR